MNTVSEPKGVVGGDVVYRRLGQEVEVLPRLIRGGWLAWKKTSSTDELVLTWFPTRGTAAASVEDLGARAELAAGVNTSDQARAASGPFLESGVVPVAEAYRWGAEGLNLEICDSCQGKGWEIFNQDHFELGEVQTCDCGIIAWDDEELAFAAAREAGLEIDDRGVIRRL